MASCLLFVLVGGCFTNTSFGFVISLYLGDISEIFVVGVPMAVAITTTFIVLAFALFGLSLVIVFRTVV